MAQKYGMSLNEAKREWARLEKASELYEEPKNQKSWRRGLFDLFLDKDFNEYIYCDEKTMLSSTHKCNF
jgi:hypothetical protein